MSWASLRCHSLRIKRRTQEAKEATYEIKRQLLIKSIVYLLFTLKLETMNDFGFFLSEIPEVNGVIWREGQEGAFVDQELQLHDGGVLVADRRVHSRPPQSGPPLRSQRQIEHGRCENIFKPSFKTFLVKNMFCCSGKLQQFWVANFLPCDR